MPNLPISRLIDVSVVLSPRAALAQDLSTLLILGGSDVIDVVERLRTYDSIEAVVDDFGTALPEYLAAVLWFEQAPQPSQLKIGRWAQTPTKGKLVCAPLSAANKLIAAWTVINNGGFNVDINGAGPGPIGPLDFSAVANLNGVADVITAGLAGAVCVYNSVYGRFEFKSNAVGAGSSISLLTAGGGTDISGMLAGTVDDSGAYVADGIDAETAVAAATLFDSKFGQTWYGLTVLGALDADHLGVAAYVEASNNKHLYGVSTQEAGVLSAVVDTDIAFLLKALKYNRTVVQYSSTNPYSVCSLLGRGLTVDYNGNNTVITLMYKQEPGISAEQLTSTQADALEGKNCNVFVQYNNDTAIVEPGKTSSGNFIDELTGTDWLAVTIMSAVYNLLYTSPTKIPQTDGGVHLILTTIESVCSQGVTNGLLAPGTWNSGGFGILGQGDYLDKGFYVFANPVATQAQADREARKAPTIQVAAKLAGAVHTADVIINVNR